MSLTALGATVSTLATEGESHFPPTAESFWQPMWHLGPFAITRPMVLMAISVGLLCWWLLATTRNAKVVPSKGQWFTEQVYNLARNGIARDMIGTHEFMRYVPLLFSMFVLILLNNLFGIIPPFQFPTMSRIGFPIALTLLVYLVFHGIGIKRKGVGGYFASLLPGGLPGWIKPFIFLLELITYFITRPLTLALRLFGNMFAGHMLLVVFIVGGYELLKSGQIGLMAVSIPAYVLAFVMTLFEGLVQFLQAYIFTLLAASYIGGALADEH